MQEKEWTIYDRTEWERGLWDFEPDKVQWEDPATGLPCLAVRHAGHWCGYVGLSEGHPFYNVAYNSCPKGTETKVTDLFGYKMERRICSEEDYCDHRPEHILQVHGGVTYSGRGHPEEPNGISLEAEPLDLWWFGFDCAHGWDYRPATSKVEMDIRKKYPVTNEDVVYRHLPYVKEQVRQLAKQLKALLVEPLDIALDDK